MLITGCVWNSHNHPPYLPNRSTTSTLKTRSTPNIDDDAYNELRFEDKKGLSFFLCGQQNFERKLSRLIFQILILELIIYLIY